MIVCVCNNISDREIRQAIDLGISSMDELRETLGVATCCGNCLTYASKYWTSMSPPTATCSSRKRC